MVVGCKFWLLFQPENPAYVSARMRRMMAQSRGNGIDTDLHVTDSAGDSGWETVNRGNSPTSTTE